MPFRMNDQRARLAFLTSVAMPSLLQKGAQARGLGSATQYVNHVLCAALAADLSIPLEELTSQIPQGRNANGPGKGPGGRPGPIALPPDENVY